MGQNPCVRFQNTRSCPAFTPDKLQESNLKLAQLDRLGVVSSALDYVEWSVRKVDAFIGESKVDGLTIPPPLKLAIGWGASRFGLGNPATVLLDSCDVLLNPHIRRLCLKVCAELKSILSAFKEHRDVKSAIIRFVAVIMEYKEGSEEYKDIFCRISQVLEGPQAKLDKKKQLVKLTQDAFEKITISKDFSPSNQAYCRVILENLLPVMFEKFLPEDQTASPIAEGESASGNSGEAAAAGSFLQSLRKTGGDAVSAIVLDPRVQSVVLDQVIQRSNVPEKIKRCLKALSHVLILLPAEAHCSLKMYQFSSQDHLIVILRLENGCFFGNQQLHTHIVETLGNSCLTRSRDQHIQRLLSQCEEYGNCIPTKASAVRLQLLTNVHYLFHHVVRFLSLLHLNHSVPCSCFRHLKHSKPHPAPRHCPSSPLVAFWLTLPYSIFQRMSTNCARCF